MWRGFSFGEGEAAAHPFAVSDDLLNLCAVYLLWPAAFGVQNSPVDEDHWVCVYLQVDAHVS